MSKKLFGNSASGGRFSGESHDTAPQKERETVSPAALKDRREDRENPRRRKKKRSGLKTAIILLSVVLCIEILYCVAIFSDIPFIKRLRNMYIETAMSTMSHHWLAEAFIPGDIVREVTDRMEADRQGQIGVSSNWGTEPKDPADTEASEATLPAVTVPEETTEPTLPGEEDFYDLFWELDRASMEAYIEDHPETLDNSWNGIYINEAGLDDSGTSIMTTEGDQVLAVDAVNKILLIRVKGSGYRGVLAVAKDKEKLHLFVSESIGWFGQLAGEIAEANNGVLACTGSGFIDDGGGGNGGAIAGYCMSDGQGYGYHYGWGYKRLELHEDNRFYITDAYTYVSDGTTDAMEFWPAMIVDGEILLNSDWGGINPRCCLGQNRREEFQMLVIEGRLLDSMGTDVQECSRIMARYDCYQAMNMDGGTSAIMWYDGEYITRCSNTNLSSGRYLPNAWVYTR